jgi:hypothetical protein
MSSVAFLIVLVSVIVMNAVMLSAVAPLDSRTYSGIVHTRMAIYQYVCFHFMFIFKIMLNILTSSCATYGQ